MKYKYTGSSPALLSIDGKLTMVSPGAIFSSSNALETSQHLEIVPGPSRPKKKVEKKAKVKIDVPTRNT